MKVLIVDDEPKVCQLIRGLIDWQGMGFDGIFEAHRGADALEIIASQNISILITDIRMPGMDGIHLIKEINRHNPQIAKIIISGYGEFEYAKSAMQFGASDYLLKPINKIELTNAVEKIKKQKSLAVESVNLKNFRQKLFEDFRAGHFNKSLKEINESYGYSFQDSFFEIFVIKIDFDFQGSTEQLSAMYSQIDLAIKHYIKPYCYELDFVFKSSVIVGICNFSTKEKSMVQLSFQKVLDTISLHSKNIKTDLEFTIALGGVVGFEGLSEAYSNSMKSIERRLTEGSGQVYLSIQPTSLLKIDELVGEWKEGIAKSLELLDSPRLICVTQTLLTRLMNMPNLQGWEYKSVVVCLAENFTSLLKSKNIAGLDYQTDFDSFITNAEYCGSLSKLAELFCGYLSQTVEQVKSRLIDEPARPIRLAKIYIDENYMKPITLEEVGEYVGFSSSYFSSIFKKETGKNFLEYLSELRVEKSKNFLVSTNENISAIARRVGYSDVKHFNKVFKRYAFLKPNEYRKMYS